MQLAQHDIRTEDTSETEPILSQSSTAERSEECSSSIEITVGVDSCTIAAADLSIPDIDEDIALVRADQPQCRICLDTEGEDLIAPCHCKGTQSMSTDHVSIIGGQQRAKFILRANVPPDRWWLRLKFQFLVARDHAIIFVIVQLIVAFLGVLVYKFYGEELREMFGYEEHPYGFYTMAVLAIVLVGLLYGFFIAIICGQRINERHYHVLAKQELTKEYVVEDREANKGVSELDPSHVTELRMLGLY
ncbi:hypothetical protein Sango_1652300 [Sesamum angolense]|uniref:RING-CH-type domain-containing protein n=1 Tax=Sesamum angolense TaxID=2727404 RepID=A0AAE1WKD5_9LAMI|nr:hypothetical protein Sango_1652300 [Sesamum angolense]